MRYYDISLNLSPDTVRWVVAPPLEVHERRRMSRGDDVNATALTVSVHAGTHLDAPFHFLPDGAGIDSVPLERFMGPALVHHVDTDRLITEARIGPSSTTAWCSSKASICRRSRPGATS